MSNFNDYILRQLRQAHKDGKKLVITCPPRNSYTQYREHMDAWMYTHYPQLKREMESMDEKQKDEFELPSIQIEYQEVSSPIKKVTFYSSGGRKFQVQNYSNQMTLLIEDNKEEPVKSSFNKAHLGEFIKLLTKMHDQLP
jgi:hypothetical protein